MRIEVRVEVRDRAFEAAESLRNYVGLRLMSVLDHLVWEVEGVTVVVADVSGDMVQKRCRMLAQVTASGEVAVEEKDAGLYAAIDRAAKRLARGVALASAPRELAPLPHLRGQGVARAPAVVCGPNPCGPADAPIVTGQRLDMRRDERLERASSSFVVGLR